ncbi:MAG: hypothetical protein JRJ80_17690 [Deltaproteobacteria bacterium]|nr:hypothetical protein [Deltaproteobacteria bacterium]MBW1876035.1 hypothetical protein [Deltaproteobacteria bacterium]MBW2162417.1 hypothetical protein [Deltaproteobacteria bacterium]
MKKLLPALALLSLCTSAWLAPSSASAVPKMDVKVAVGVGSTTFVSKVPTIDLYSGGPDNPVFEGTVGGTQPATFTNWGLMLSARVRAGKVFGEIGIGFSRFYFEVSEELVLIAELEGDPLVGLLLGETARMNSLEIPMTAGYVPYANPYFKLFLYGGLVNTFNIRGFVDLNGNRKALKFKPHDVPGYPIAIYIAGARLGVQFDLGPLNFDFNYTINMNSATKTEFRTNTHVFKMFLGWLF